MQRNNYLFENCRAVNKTVLWTVFRRDRNDDSREDHHSSYKKQAL